MGGGSGGGSREGGQEGKCGVALKLGEMLGSPHGICHNISL